MSSPDRPEDLVVAVLDQAQLPGVEDHANVLVLKVELLVPARRRPDHLAQQVLLQVAEEQRLRRPGHQVPVLAHDLDVLDLVAVLGLEHHAPALALQRLDEHLARADERHLPAVVQHGTPGQDDSIIDEDLMYCHPLYWWIESHNYGQSGFQALDKTALAGMNIVHA